MTEEFCAVLERFLRLHVESFDELNVLLLVAAESRQWTSESLAQALKMTSAAAESALGQLVARALVAGPSTPDGAYKYAPASVDIDLMVKALAVARREQPLALTNVMNAQAMDRLRRAALKAFADAFKLRGPGNA